MAKVATMYRESRSIKLFHIFVNLNKISRDTISFVNFIYSTNKKNSNEKYSNRGLHDIWGNQLPPRDLHRGIYRGGRRPIDIYRRIVVGIKGTPMPGTANKLQPEQVWDLVNYVLSIPTENQ